MRLLTHYELRVLIKNEVHNMAKDAFEDGAGVTVHYQKERAKDILKYITEYEALGPMED